MAAIEIIHGRDDFLVREKIDQKLKHIPPAFRELYYSKYFGWEGVEEEMLLDEVATLPFGCEHKLIVIEDYQKIKNKNLVPQLIETCPPSCFLILISTDLNPFNFKPKPLEAKLQKVVQAHKNKAQFTSLKKLEAGDLKNASPLI